MIAGNPDEDTSSNKLSVAAELEKLQRETHGRVCAVCAEACEACAKSCEQVGDMRECAEECRRCAKSCRTMA